MPYFEQENLNETDLIFVKELIFGELNKQAVEEVWPYKGRDISKSFLYEVGLSVHWYGLRKTVNFRCLDCLEQTHGHRCGQVRLFRS